MTSMANQGEETVIIIINIVYFTLMLRFNVLSSAREWSVEVEINRMSQLCSCQQKVLPALQTTDYYVKASPGFDCKLE